MDRKQAVISSSDGPGVESKLNVAAAEFIPSQPIDYTESEDTGSYLETRAQADILYSITLLRNSPEAFYDIAHPLAVRLSTSLHDDETLTSVIETLFQESCNDANFRYTGARLCSLLCSSLPEDKARSFRSKLLARCHKEFSRKEELAEKNHSELINFTLFMGELMHSLTIDGQVIVVSPDNTIELLSQLLNIHTDETIHGFFQGMKLLGAILEKHNSTKLMELFAEIKKLIADQSTSEGNRSKLLILIELRACQWLVANDGGNQPASGTAFTNSVTVECDYGAAAVAASDENFAVYYEDCDEGHDGLDDLCDDRDFEIIYDGDVPYEVPCDEMDAEMLEDYEKFVAENEANWRPLPAKSKP